MRAGLGIGLGIFDGDWPPNCLFRLDAGTNVTQSGGLVSDWQDFFGRNIHATAAGGARPTFEATGWNGKPSILGDGIANVMQVSSQSWTQPITIIGAIQLVTKVTGATAFDGLTLNHCRLYDDNDVHLWNLYAGAAGPTVADSTSRHILAAVFNGANSRLSIDGGAPATADAGANNPDGLTLFADGAPGGYANLRIAGLVVCAGAFNTGAVVNIANQMATLYPL